MSLTLSLKLKLARLKKNNLILILLCSLLFQNETYAQRLVKLSTKFNDAFGEFELYGENDVRGSLTLTWQQPDKWTEWNFRMGDTSGTIKTKWNDDVNFWEIRYNNKIATAQTIFKNDFSQWRITNNNFSLDLAPAEGNNPNEWWVEDTKRGSLYLATEVPNDPRDWLVQDELSEEVPFAMRMAIIFVAIYQTIPKS